MGFTLLIATVALAVLLGFYIFLRHEDKAAGGVCLLIAATAAGVWYAGEVDKDALEQEIQAGEERLAELETTPAQRGFTAQARAQMVTALSGFVGPTAFVLANSSDLETTEYAREIVNILNDAGWDVPPSFGMTYRPVLLPGHDGVPKGVVLGVSSEVPDQFGASIFNAFRDGGVEVTRGPHWPGTEHPISILVGPPKAP